MSNRAKYQMARGKVAQIAESLGFYCSLKHSKENAVPLAIQDCKDMGIDKDSVCRIARRLGYPVHMVLGQWVIKTTGKEL